MISRFSRVLQVTSGINKNITVLFFETIHFLGKIKNFENGAFTRQLRKKSTLDRLGEVSRKRFQAL